MQIYFSQFWRLGSPKVAGENPLPGLQTTVFLMCPHMFGWGAGSGWGGNKEISSSFFNYIVLIMLLQLSWFFPLCPSPPSAPYSLRQALHHCSCPWVTSMSCLAAPCPILNFTSPWLFCNYLFVLLSPLTSSPIPHTPLPFGNHQNAFCIHDALCSSCCLVCFLDSVVDRYVFVAILFIILIF